MRRKTLILFFLSLLPLLISAQKTKPLHVELATISFEVIERSGKLDLQFDPIQSNTNNFNIDHVVVITNLRLEEADLWLEYELGPIEPQFHYFTNILLLDQAQNTIAPLPFKLKGDIRELSAGLAGKRSVRWLDALEEVLIFGKKYKLVLNIELLGPFDCEQERPAFKLAQQLPHWGIAAGGLILTGIGQFQKSKKEDAYNTYKSYHANGESYELAQPFFEQAKAYEKDARLYTYAGWAVLSLDAAVYLYRVFNIKARQKIYNKYCGDKTTSLRLDTRPLWDGSKAMQVQLAFTLK